MLQVVEMVRAAGVPLAAVWLQDWVGKRRTTAGDRLWWNWVLDDHPEAGSYASWDAMRAALALCADSVPSSSRPTLSRVGS